MREASVAATHAARKKNQTITTTYRIPCSQRGYSLEGDTCNGRIKRSYGGTDPKRLFPHDAI